MANYSPAPITLHYSSTETGAQRLTDTSAQDMDDWSCLNLRGSTLEDQAHLITSVKMDWGGRHLVYGFEREEGRPLHDLSPSRHCPACSILPLHLPDEDAAPCLVNLSTINIDSLRHWASDTGHRHQCDFCRLLLDLHAFWSGDHDAYLRLITEFEKPTSKYTCTSDFEFHQIDGWRQINRYDFNGFAIKSESQDLLFNDIPTHPDPMRDNNHQGMTRWDELCNKEHPECKVKTCQLPTRVLDVSNLECIKLCESFGKHGQYIALSHCWGECRSFLTTKSTLRHMRHGFRINQMPRTFQDAVHVVRAHHQRYLWIDSLCIIQEDPDDWAKESSMMAQIYENAYFTIAAVTADCDSKGFLKRPRRFSLLTIMSLEGRRAHLYLKSRSSSIRDELFPLFFRMWTQQEQILSRRILLFEDKAVWWECPSYSSAKLEDERYRDTSNALSLTLDNPTPRDLLLPINYDNEFTYGGWCRMILQFSSRLITYDSDKLPSLAGIASRVAGIGGGTYAAGLWKQCLPQQLLWKKDNPNDGDSQTGTSWEPLVSTSCYVAPSWSWASVNGQVYLPMEGYSNDETETKGWVVTIECLPATVIHELNLLPTTHDIYGAVKEGSFLVLEAPFLKLQIIRDTPASKTNDYVPLLVPYSIGFEDSVARAFGSFDCPGELDYNKSIEMVALAYCPAGPNPDYRFGGREKPWFTGPEDWSVLYGLLIQKSEKYLGGYVRVGHFRTEELIKGEAVAILKDQEARRFKFY